MLNSIPVKDFIDPLRGSRAWNAICRAIKLKPKVVLIGTFEGERWFRVQSEDRDPHCVRIWTEDLSQEQMGKCDCPAATIPHETGHCLHLAAALIYDAGKGE